MHAPAAALRRSPWAGLDALVLEEIEALRTPPPPRREPPAPAPAPGFSSDEDFLMRALRYLAGHPDPAALVARLSAGFQLAATTDPEPPAGPNEGTADDLGAAAAPDRPVADDAEEEDRP